MAGLEPRGREPRGSVRSGRKGRDWIGTEWRGLERHGVARQDRQETAGGDSPRQSIKLFKRNGIMAVKPVASIVQITPPKLETHCFHVVGTAPLVINRFSAKAQQQMMETMLLGSAGKKKSNVKPPRDFEADFKGAIHFSTEEWCGYHAGGIRAALIDSCRLVGFVMTRAKLGIFVEADGYDKLDGAPLVRIIGDDPEQTTHHVRIGMDQTDIRIRPMWREWAMDIRLTFDTEMFTLADVTNLLMRVGVQCGLGEGRPNSSKSTGMGWGTFKIA